MNKIVVIGSPSAGKSTFAHELGRILEIEVFHLDRYFWQSGWKEYPRQIRIEIEQELIRGKDQWIIEGTYLSSSDSRLKAADTIIFLDKPWSVCLRQAFQRHFTYQGELRLDIPDGCTDKISFPYILKILVFPYKGRRLFFKKFKKLEVEAKRQGLVKKILICRSHKISAALLEALSVYQQQGVDVRENEAVLV